jgi:small subunit ribosomal protein S20
MPIIKSAKKRVKVSTKATVRNAKTKRTLREAVKAFTTAVAGGKSSEVEAAHKKANSAIDTAAKKNVLHKNKAARKKAQLSAAAKKAGVKSTGKAAPKKVAPKKAPVKKAAPAKKPAVKKQATKK